MLADRDAAPTSISSEEIQNRSNGKFRVLSRYHLENYFLEENVLAECFVDQEPEGSWLRDQDAIRSRLIEIAESYLSYATALIVSKHIRLGVGNVSVMPRGCANKTVDELSGLILTKQAEEKARVEDVMNNTDTESIVRETYSRLQQSLQSEAWKSDIPGKQVLATFASVANIPLGRLKTLYISKNISNNLGAFDEVVQIFESWA